MQSSVYPIPRCVLAQTFLDNINNQSESSGSGSSSDEDRNTDVDEKYQQSPNRLQGRQQEYRHVHHHHQHPHRHQHQYTQQYHRPQQQQVHRGGVSDVPLPSSLSLASGSLAMTVGGCGTGECNDAPLPVPGVSSNKNYAQERQQHYHSQLPSTEMHDQQSYLHHHRSGTNQHLGSTPSHSANPLPLPTVQHHHQQRSLCYPHSSSSASSSSIPGSGAYQHQQPPQQQNNHHHYSSYAHSQMSRLEAMFPPLHDNEENMSEALEHKPVKRPEHPTLDQMLKTLKATTCATVSDRVGPSRTQSTNNAFEKELPRRRAPPPPLLIPASVVQTSSDKTEKRVSPVVPSLPSPESPSGLAIHLYVHHHHHHHSQETVEKSSGTTSPPLQLLSPLTIESPSPTKTIISPPTLPSPVSPPLATSPPLVSLLPSANIPSLKDSISTQSSNKIKSLTPTEEDTQPLPWFNHPNSLANSSSASTRRPSRPIRLHQPRVRLPDPTTSAHLLSTISPQDLARLYVHAAHHLHSHQPIRHYVLMKMLMTQAELTQYGRLRAEMPRAPGPSTGALPKRTGFGTLANTGLGAQCKVASGLGRCVVTREETKKRKVERVGVEEEEGEGKVMMKEKNKNRMSWSMPLFSLRVLTGRTTTANKLGSLAEKEVHPLLPPASIDETHDRKDSGNSSSSGRRKQVKRQDSGCYASSRRLEELELGESGDERLLQTRRRSLTRSLSLTSSSSSDYEMEEMDDNNNDKDNSGQEMEEIQLDRTIRHSLAEEEEQGGERKADDYWTMLRQKNNRSRRRLIRMEDAPVLDDKEDSNMYYYQQQSQFPSQQQQQHSSKHYQQQAPHHYSDQNVIQHSSPSLHHYHHSQHPQSISSSTSYLSPPDSASPKNLARPPTKMSISPKTLIRRTSTHHHATRGRDNLTLPIIGGVVTGGTDGSDAIGLSSGLLMVSLLFGFLYLIEGTNQFHSLQSALLSIIL
ncbi:hypothetical protein BGZ52_003568 [Haplosporangium bisporale]|nr:hypothetical protein BGZ52_003568 [Haplosporangium bisporale]